MVETNPALTYSPETEGNTEGIALTFHLTSSENEPRNEATIIITPEDHKSSKTPLSVNITFSSPSGSFAFRRLAQFLEGRNCQDCPTPQNTEKGKIENSIDENLRTLATWLYENAGSLPTTPEEYSHPDQFSIREQKKRQ